MTTTSAHLLALASGLLVASASCSVAVDEDHAEGGDRGLATGDATGDGRLDLVAIDYASHQLEVLAGE